MESTPDPVAPVGDRALLYAAAVATSGLLGIGLGAAAGGFTSVATPDVFGPSGQPHILFGAFMVPAFAASLVPVMTFLYGQLAGVGGSARTLAFTYLGALMGALSAGVFVASAAASGDMGWLGASLATAGGGLVIGAIVGNVTAAEREAGRAALTVHLTPTGLRGQF